MEINTAEGRCWHAKYSNRWNGMELLYIHLDHWYTLNYLMLTIEYFKSIRIIHGSSMGRLRDLAKAKFSLEN